MCGALRCRGTADLARDRSSHGLGSVRGAVCQDEVAAVVDAVPSRQLGALFPDALVIGGDPALPVVVPDGVHPLLSNNGRNRSNRSATCSSQRRQTCSESATKTGASAGVGMRSVT